MVKTKEISYPEPDPVFTQKPSVKKYLKYLLFFGPGAIVASLTIGQGQLILGPQIGAWAGYALLWLITLNIGSYIIAYVSCRFTMLSGIGLMDLFAIKTKKGWFNWLIIIIMLIFIPIFAATIITSLGQAVQWILGIGNYLFWGILLSLVAAVVAIVGRFKLFEISHAFFIVILAIGALVTVVTIRPDLFELLPNFFTIGQNVPQEFPLWVTSNPEYSSITKTSIPLYMLAYLGTLTITLVTTIGYLGWIKVKKWGIFKGKKDPQAFSQERFKIFKENGKINYLPTDEKQVKKSKLLLKPVLIDLSLAFIIVSIVSTAYMVAGANLLGSIQKLPSDARLVQEQLVIFTYLADWLKPLFQISVIFALFGTIYAGFEAGARMLYETGQNLSKKIKDFEYKRFMLYFLVYILVIAVPLAIRMYVDPNFSVLFFLSITLLFIGVIGVIVYGVGVIILSQTVLPEKYKLGKLGLFFAVLAVVFMCIPLIYLFI